MKQFTILLLAVLFFQQNGLGQNAIGFGVGAYYGTADITNLDSSTTTLSHAVGTQFKTVFEFGKSKILAFQTEFILTQKGFKTNYFIGDSANYYSAETTTRFTYLQIPLLLKLKFGATDKVGGYIALGPSLNIALGGSQKVVWERRISFPSQVYDDEGEEQIGLGFANDENTESDYSKIDWSVLAKVGLTVPIGKGYLFTDVGYDLGLSDIDKGTETDEVLKNKGFTWSIGYAFRLSE